MLARHLHLPFDTDALVYAGFLVKLASYGHASPLPGNVLGTQLFVTELSHYDFHASGVR
jgi:creatinine amidohydrolase/Fe(II)-dependent formamide hydrolase-like protein